MKIPDQGKEINPFFMIRNLIASFLSVRSKKQNNFVMADPVFETEWSQETSGTLGDPRWDCWFNTSLKVQGSCM